MEQRVVVVTAAVGVVSVIGLLWWLTRSNKDEKSRGARSRSHGARRSLPRPKGNMSENNSGLDTRTNGSSRPPLVDTPALVEESAPVPSDLAGPASTGKDCEPAESMGNMGSPPTVLSDGLLTGNQSAASLEPVQKQSLQAHCSAAASSCPAPEADIDLPPLELVECASGCLPGVLCYQRIKPLTDDSKVCVQVLVEADLLGRFIGRNGQFIKQLKQSGASVDLVSRQSGQPCLCTISGRSASVQEVLGQVRERFPSVANKWVEIVTDETEYARADCPHPGSARWPDSAAKGLVDAVVINIDSPSRFHVHLSKHGAVRELNEMSQFMAQFYKQSAASSSGVDLEIGFYCAALVKNDWARGLITADNGEEWSVELLDFGVNILCAKTSVRMLKSEFCSIPFQAVQCELANVKPMNVGHGWQGLPTDIFRLVVEGIMVEQVQCRRVGGGRDTDSAIAVEMYLQISKQKDLLFVNRSLVDKGCAQWVENF